MQSHSEHKDPTHKTYKQQQCSAPVLDVRLHHFKDAGAKKGPMFVKGRATEQSRQGGQVGVGQDGVRGQKGHTVR